jgi:hypothetical protein
MRFLTGKIGDGIQLRPIRSVTELFRQVAILFETLPAQLV